MSKKVISWITLDLDETYELKDNERIIGTHVDEFEDEIFLVLVIENEGGLK